MAGPQLVGRHGDALGAMSLGSSLAPRVRDSSPDNLAVKFQRLVPSTPGSLPPPIGGSASAPSDRSSSDLGTPRPGRFGGVAR